MPTKIDLVVMDWGIGGLSVYNELIARAPHLAIAYFSDSGQTPYGKMSTRELRDRLLKIFTSFHAQGARHFVVACNAASTALPSLRADLTALGVEVTGVIEHGVALVRGTNFKRVGVIGGLRTIRSRTYVRQLATAKRRVRGRVAQPLSALIERGELTTPHLVQTLESILRPLASCDALLLACTHYPAVAGPIQAILPNCQLLDPAAPTADFITRRWKLGARPAKSKMARSSVDHPRHLFLTTGNAASMRRAAALAFGLRLKQVKELSSLADIRL